MKTTKKYYRLFALGLLILNFDFIIKHFATISDGWIGTIKGFGLGIMIGSMILISKYKKNQDYKPNCGN